MQDKLNDDSLVNRTRMEIFYMTSQEALDEDKFIEVSYNFGQDIKSE